MEEYTEVSYWCIQFNYTAETFEMPNRLENLSIPLNNYNELVFNVSFS